jgi:hypothetical protein
MELSIDLCYARICYGAVLLSPIYFATLISVLSYLDDRTAVAIYILHFHGLLRHGEDFFFHQITALVVLMGLLLPVLVHLQT